MNNPREKSGNDMDGQSKPQTLKMMEERNSQIQYTPTKEVLYAMDLLRETDQVRHSLP